MTAVITSSEVMTAEQLRLMREVFGGPVVDHYGQTERVAMAGNCEAGGYHQFPDYGIVELLPVAGPDRPLGDRRHPAAQLGLPAVPLPDRRRGRTPPRPGHVPAGERSRCSAGSTAGSRTPSPPPTDDRYPCPNRGGRTWSGCARSRSPSWRPATSSSDSSPTDGTDLAAAQEQARQNVEKYFGPGQTVTFRSMDHIPREPSGKLKPALRVTIPGGAVGACW